MCINQGFWTWYLTLYKNATTKQTEAIEYVPVVVGITHGVITDCIVVTIL